MPQNTSLCINLRIHFWTHDNITHKRIIVKRTTFIIITQMAFVEAFEPCDQDETETCQIRANPAMYRETIMNHFRTNSVGREHNIVVQYFCPSVYLVCKLLDESLAMVQSASTAVYVRTLSPKSSKTQLQVLIIQ